MTNEEIKLIDEYTKFCDNYDIKIRSVGIAQLMIESSHGKSNLSLNNNNPFGIKYTCDNCDYSVDYETKEHFKNYILDSLNSGISEDQILFLFNKYSVQYSHNCEKLTDDMTSKLYQLKYRFSLK